MVRWCGKSNCKAQNKKLVCVNHGIIKSSHETSLFKFGFKKNMTKEEKEQERQ
jgi:hypothetical protein